MGGPDEHKGEDEQNEGGVADPEDELQHEAHQEELGKGALMPTPGCGALEDPAEEGDHQKPEEVVAACPR